MSNKILYLGVDPSRYLHTGELIHYPVIRTIPIEALDETTQQIWPRVTHLVFTSPSAVKHWTGFASCEQKAVIAIGPATASLLRNPLIAPFATQEGVIALLETLELSEAYFLLPRSSRARPLLTEYLQRRGVGFLALDLYQTIPHNPGPLPAFDEIVFTSPSTVEAFLQLHGCIPRDKKITAIGPVTKNALPKIFVEEYTCSEFNEVRNER